MGGSSFLQLKRAGTPQTPFNKPYKRKTRTKIFLIPNPTTKKQQKHKRKAKTSKITLSKGCP